MSLWLVAVLCGDERFPLGDERLALFRFVRGLRVSAEEAAVNLRSLCGFRFECKDEG